MKRITIRRGHGKGNPKYIVSGYGTASFCDTLSKAKRKQKQKKMARKKAYGR